MHPNASKSHAPPLLEGWSTPDLVDDVVTADGIALRRAGLASTSPEGVELTGSAASLDESPVERAHYELLERMATMQALSRTTKRWQLWSRDRALLGTAPQDEAFPANDTLERWRFARSSGVALHVDWDSACIAARAELAERDRVLRSWYGEVTPVEVEVPALLSAAESYEWKAFALPARAGSWSADVAVAGVIGFPRDDVPLLFGYGAAPDADGAMKKAVAEVLQSLAFLWGESSPDKAPELAPSALGHLEWWLYRGHHERLRGWLDGEHARHAREPTSADPGNPGAVRYLDLTPTGFRDHVVVKALSPAAAPLVFGESPFAAHLPATLRVHPIV